MMSARDDSFQLRANAPGPPEAPGTPVRYSALTQLVLARVREFYRRPAAVFWVYVFPLLLAIALGIAFRNRPVERIPVDLAEGADARSLDGVATKLERDPRLEVARHPAAECERRLRNARTDLVVSLPADASAAAPVYEYGFDPNRSESVLARALVDDVLVRATCPTGPAVRERHPEGPGGRYIDFLVPGLIGINLMGGGLWGVGFAIVEMRVRKLLKRFMATPMPRAQFLLGLGISRLLFTLPGMVFLIGASYLLFDVRIRGSVGALAAVVLLGAASFMGVGLLIACRAATLEMVQSLVNLVMLPMYIVSGVFFSSDRFPDAAQPFIRALPLTALNRALRAVMLEGESFDRLWPQLAILTAWGGLSFALALRFFRWK